MNYKVFIKGLMFLMVLAGAAYLLSRGIDKSWIDNNVRGQGIKGWFVFISIGGLLAAVGFPRQVVAFLGGYAFGVIKGLSIALLAVTLGCLLTFFYARFFGRAWVKRKFPRKIKRVDDFLKDSPFAMTLLIRLLPVGNNMATSAAAGVSGVSPFAFIAGLYGGICPPDAGFCLGRQRYRASIRNGILR